MEISTKENYSKAYVQVLEIIKYMGKEYEEKIPARFLKIMEKNKDTSYQYSIDEHKKLEEQELFDETLGILSIIELKYWALPEEKELLSIALKENEIEYQKQLSEKYNIDNLFRKKEQVKEEVAIIEYKESIFKKIINKIKTIFGKK